MKKKKSGLRKFFQGVYSIRGLLLSIPVIAAAVFLAIRNYEVLPQSVGLFLKDDNTYFLTVSRLLAILVPALITGLCAGITCFAKKVFYPWLISIFTLVLPLLLWITTVFGI